MELLRLVEGVRIIKDKIVVEDSYVKRGVYGETIASNLGIDSKVIWEHLRENVFNIKDGLEEIESIAHLGVQGKKVGVSARQLKAWFGEIVSIYETTQLAYKAAVALEESLGHLGEIKTILKHNNFSGILKENAKCLEQCLGLQREKWPSTISEWEFLFDEVKQVKDAFRSYNTKELSFHYQQLFSMSEQEQAPLIEKDIDGMISYIVEDCESLSSKSIYEARVFESLQDETKKRGTSEGILLSAYIQQFFSHYSREECFDGSALRYEQEYIIAGKESDVDNIREVARQILQLRMGIAFLALVKDSEASSMAYATAASCVGFTGVEPIIKGMQYTILGVWAYEEACIDTAIILGGGRLPIQKRGDEFHVGYTELASFNKEMVQLKKKQYIGDKGVTYDKYLGILLLLQDEKVRVYRSMDLIQLNLSKSYSDLFSFQHALYSSRCYIYCTDGLEANTYYCY